MLPSQLATYIEPNGYCSLVTLAHQWKLPYNFIAEVGGGCIGHLHVDI